MLIFSVAMGVGWGMSVTLTGNNNYSGIYHDVDVLGGANAGGGTYYDTNHFGSTPGGAIDNETFLFGNLQHTSTTTTTGDISSGSYNTTATGTSGDTLVFSFTLHLGNAQTSHFLDAAPAHAPDTDDGGAVDLYSEADINGWLSSYLGWVDSLSGSSFTANPNDATAYNAALGQAIGAAQAAGWSLADLAKVETGAKNLDGTTGQHIDDDSDPVWSGLVDATKGGPDTLTSDHQGNKILLGFGVGSDHLSLNGDSTITNAQFDQFFTITGDTHISANNNIVNDTVISLGAFTAHTGTAAGDYNYGTSAGGWSVDLYGVNIADLQAAAALAHQSLYDYVYDTFI